MYNTNNLLYILKAWLVPWKHSSIYFNNSEATLLIKCHCFFVAARTHDRMNIVMTITRIQWVYRLYKHYNLYRAWIVGRVYSVAEISWRTLRLEKFQISTIESVNLFYFMIYTTFLYTLMVLHNIDTETKHVYMSLTGHVYKILTIVISPSSVCSWIVEPAKTLLCM